MERVAGVIFAGLCGFFTVTGTYRRCWALYAAWRGATAQGRVTRISVTKTQSRRAVPHDHVAFTTANGQTIEFREFHASYDEPGTTVTVRYAPRRPRFATITTPQQVWPQVLGLGAMALFFLGFAIGAATGLVS